MKDNVTMENEKSPVQLMQIFRAADAPNFSETDHQTIEPFSPVQREGMDKVIAAGVSEGHELRCLVDLPGFSLT